MRRVTSASRERRLRTSEHKSRTRKNCNAVCAAASEYRNAAFSSHEDKDRAGPKRELLHCAVRFRVEQHRPPPSESFTTASSPILMAAAIVGPTTRFASTSTISFRIVPRNNGNSTKHHHSAMFSAANDTIPLFRPRRGRDDRDAGAGLMRNPNQINNVPRRETDAQGKRRVGGEAGHAQRREANALAPRGTTRNVRHLTRGGNRHVSREGGRDNRSILRVSGEQLGAACGEPAKQPCHSAQTGTVRETRAPPHTKRGQCANREHRPTPPEKDQNAQTEHLGMARSARRA